MVTRLWITSAGVRTDYLRSLPMRLRSWGTVAAGAALIMLGGCGEGAGGEAAARVVSIPTAAPSPSVSPTTPAPTPTADVTSENYESAENFVAHYIEALNHSYATGDVDNLKGLTGH